MNFFFFFTSRNSHQCIVVYFTLCVLFWYPMFPLNGKRQSNCTDFCNSTSLVWTVAEHFTINLDLWLFDQDAIVNGNKTESRIINTNDLNPVFDPNCYQLTVSALVVEQETQTLSIPPFVIIWSSFFITYPSGCLVVFRYMKSMLQRFKNGRALNGKERMDRKTLEWLDVNRDGPLSESMCVSVWKRIV